MLHAGDLRETVTLMRDSVHREQGVEVRNPEAYGTAWASVRFLSGRERWQAQQVQSTANVEVTMRYRADVLASDWLTWKGYRLEIKGEPIPAPDRSSLTLMCEAKRA